MKKLLLIPMVIFLVSTGCEKDSTFLRSSLPVNQPPEVFAGANINVFLPVDTAHLSGTATDTENNIDSLMWKQISGPGQAVIHTPNSLKTKVSNLIKGEYRFELTVIDKGKLSGKDTANIIVLENNFMIFNVFEVTCWGPECTILVDILTTNIFQYFPITVFLKSTDSSLWLEIPQQNCHFFPNSQYFVIDWYNVDELKKWEVMIVY